MHRRANYVWDTGPQFTESLPSPHGDTLNLLFKHTIRFSARLRAWAKGSSPHDQQVAINGDEPMTREPISLTLPDVSAFARALKSDLGAEAVPHQTLLNAIARAGGYRNFQHLSAAQGGAAPIETPEGRAVTRALARFDEAGLMASWSTKRKVRQTCLWALWAQVPARTVFTERQISDLFDTMTTFRDPAQIRRSLIEDGLLTRTLDGSQYTRVEVTPDVTAREVIRAVNKRRTRANPTVTQ